MLAEYMPDLADLVGDGLGTVGFDDDPILDARPYRDVMAASDTFLDEAESKQEVAKILESDRGISLPAHEALKGSAMAAHCLPSYRGDVIVLSLECRVA